MFILTIGKNNSLHQPKSGHRKTPNLGEEQGAGTILPVIVHPFLLFVKHFWMYHSYILD